jgi:Fe-S cluster biogenesis protein NfuA
MQEQQTVLEIYTESTPNPESLKFVCVNAMLLANKNVDFRTPESATDSPLATELFSRSFVDGVFISNNFVTITKKENYDWFEISPEIKELIKNWVLSGREILSAAYFEKQQETAPQEGNAEDPAFQIKQLLDKYVRPAVEMDGGHIEFQSFQDGIVTVSMQGSCSGCPSSMVTLKNGIEGLLKRMVPGVEEVIARED